ncbi:EAL domain-containing protein [Nitrosomonas sp. Is24]|uniref:EAL domain-containing protein n=1 Tax=Nitrosomonas sp. Is24 TaxID=3080533 RepID=UPI00294B8C11|nr:EAL domain-containing protein [Nitrosomonas sp. Is24]MDV6340620.1 EAL domain-containing protein [Nitrosomonas sp. Is24]
MYLGQLDDRNRTETGLRLVAEGVETPAQLNILRNLNCEIVQGYLFSKSAAADSISELLNSQTQKEIFERCRLDEVM